MLAEAEDLLELVDEHQQVRPLRQSRFPHEFDQAQWTAPQRGHQERRRVRVISPGLAEQRAVEQRRARFANG